MQAMGEARIDEAIASGRVPPGITAAYLNESRDTPTIIGIIFVTCLTSVIVVGRLLSRIFIIQRFGFDDVLVFMSLLTFIVFVGLSIELLNLGSARHFAYIQYVLDGPTVQRTQVLDYVAHLLYSTALLLCRLSGLAFYRRVCGLHRGFLVGNNIVFSILIAGYLPQILLIVFHCQPLTGLWPYPYEPHAAEYTCLRWGLVYLTISSISLICDLLLFGIPVAMLRRLEMPRKRKIQLACILLPGVAVIGISIARLVLVIRGQWEDDMSWEYNAMIGVEVSEIGGTMIALSVPGVKPLVDRYILRKDMGTHSSRGKPKDDELGGSHSPNGTSLTALKLRPHYDVLETQDGTAQYGTQVSAGSQPGITSREGIHVTVDFHVKGAAEVR